jgi:hypothetical protein
MPKDIFISYSRRDQEFVTRLAHDLNAQVAGVWFDQSTIQVGQKWHDEIMDGIGECKALILVLSPDALESKYVREEVNKALELGKTIFPILYRPAKWTGEFELLVREIQTLDLRSGSYTDNFHKLVDGLIEGGAAKATGERPFLRQATTAPLNIVFSKVPGWAFAWSLGWLIYWLAFAVYFAIASAIANSLNSEGLGFVIPFVVSGGIGGFAGGLIAGLFTMLALRPNAPSIHWRHMSPAIRIWGISGLLGMLPALVITISALPAHLTQATFVVWCFLTGIVAGVQAVRHIRRLEPGITNPQSTSVSFGWGCAALVGATVTFELSSLLPAVILW